MHPAMGLGTMDLKQDAGHIKGRIAFDIKEDEKQFILGRSQHRLTAPARLPLPRLAWIGPATVRKHSGKTVRQVDKFEDTQSRKGLENAVRAQGMINTEHRSSPTIEGEGLSEIEYDFHYYATSLI